MAIKTFSSCPGKLGDIPQKAECIPLSNSKKLQVD